MASSQISPRFVIFVVVSLLTHLMDVAASGLFCHMLMQQGDLKTPWFSISAGLLIIPLVGLQLISAVFLLRRKGESATTMEVTLTAVLHVLQLGFISRHFAILQESSIPSRKYEITEMLVLRLVFSLTSGLPLLLIKLHVIFQDMHEASWDWTLYLTSATALLAITWALATFRRRLSGLTIDALLITCPGTLLKIVWRAGEVTTRVVALSLFASLYSYWLFLVIGLHWFAMLVCVCIPAITPIEVRTDSFLYRSLYSLVASFTYVFVFINTTCENTVFRYTFYYIIFFLENTTLVTVWSVQASSADHTKHEAFVYIAAASFIVSIISMILYYKFFHIATPKDDPSTVCGSPSCGSCKLNMATSHPPIPPRPGATGHWLSQYHTAIYCGQHCKHNGQDSLLDSTSERNSILTVSSSHARLQQKLATIDDDRAEHSSSCKTTARANSSSHLDSSASEHQKVSHHSKSRKKNKKKNESSRRSDSEKTSSNTGGNNSEGSESQKQPVWLPSSDSNFANQLLTYSLETFDTNNAADDERSSVATGVQDVHFRPEISSREISSVHKHMDNGTWATAKDRHWYSDGYSTDRTLDWGNFPVTSPQRSNRYKSSLDTDEETFHCHECSHGDSEVSSIMRSINDLPEPYPSGRRSREISPRDINGKDHRKHNHPHHQHHHQHHHHNHHDIHRHTHGHHRQSRNVESRPKASDVSRGFATNSDKLNQQLGLSSHVSGSNRTHILPSPASDPSHGPRSKRKGSPKRRVHGSAHPDRSPSKITSQEPANMNVKVHQSTLPIISPTDSRILAQSEQMAKELLAKSSAANKSKNKQTKNSSATPTPDPRFNVRVMLPQCPEGQKDNKPHTETNPHRSSVDNKLDDKKPDNNNINISTSGKQKIFGVTERETDVDRYVPSNGDEDSAFMSHSLDKDSNSPRERRSAADSGVAQTTSSDDSPVSDSTGGKDDVIYENIWQVKQDDELTKSKLDKKNHAFVPNPPSKPVPLSQPSSNVRDAWYMCSESEDSALPQEALNSSVDGFTPSENGSDVSVEIVI